jgi:hypothetical protein
MVNLTVKIKDQNGVLACLMPTLHTWLNVIQEYTHRIPKSEAKDYSYWQIEQTQVGFFSIAAWNNGWAVLQEWPTKKKNGAGRNDLWIGRENTQLFIEAKIGQCLIDKEAANINYQIRECLEVAKKDAANLLDSISGIKIGAVFIAPKCQRNEKLNLKTAVENWRDGILKSDADALAMIIPEDFPENISQFLYPGSALLLAIIPNNNDDPR